MKSKIIVFKKYLFYSLFTLLLSACASETVENPNSVLESDINIKAVSAVVNGAVYKNKIAIGYLLAPTSTVSDEVTWIGSRNAWGNLDNGQLDDIYNEFVDAVWPEIASAVWNANNSLKVIADLEAAGEEVSIDIKANAYLQQAIIHMYVAENYSEFIRKDITADKTTPGLKESNMQTFLDDAITALTAALALNPSAEIKSQLLAVRARAYFSKEILAVINNPNKQKNFVKSQNAINDAKAAIDAGFTSYQYQFAASSDDRNDMSWQINGRSELEVGIAYGVNDSGDPLPVDFFETSVAVKDLSDNRIGETDPRVATTIGNFFNNAGSSSELSPITVVSAKELHLMIAEHAYASKESGYMDTVLAHLNKNRDNMTAYTASNVNIEDAIVYERRVNLFLQGRRLLDMYRFGQSSVLWDSVENAAKFSGTLFPITYNEIISNPNVD